MTVSVHPFFILRQTIKRTGKQFRHNDDNSPSLFHPEKGFIQAYDIGEVEEALDIFEQTLGSEYQEKHPPLNAEEQIARQAQLLVDCHPSLDTRNFAKLVQDYFRSNPGKRSVGMLQRLRSSEFIPEPSEEESTY